MQDLEEAITLDQEALEIRSQGHLNRPLLLDNLADHLSTRYKQLGATEDLQEAIFLVREALYLRPQGHPHRTASLSSLAMSLFSAPSARRNAGPQ